MLSLPQSAGRGTFLSMTQITQEELKNLLDYNPDTGVFTWLTTRRGCAQKGSVAGSTDTKGRRQIKVFGKMHFAHRLAFLWMIGRFPKNQVDHIDRNPSNNAWFNLREATNSQNSINRKTARRLEGNQSLPKGVHPLKSGGYYSVIKECGKIRRLGRFATVQEAASAFRDAALRRDSVFVPPEIK